MGKCLEIYRLLKGDNQDIIYIFHSGNFHILINEDARLINQALGFKITDFGKEAVKCGFPNNSLKTHLEELKRLNIKYQIIDNGIKIKEENEEEYVQQLSQNVKVRNDTEKYIKIGKLIEELDLEEISPKELYKIISNFQNKLRGDI